MTIIDQLPDNLPESAEKIERAFQDCQKEKREIVKTKTFVAVSKEEYQNYLTASDEELKFASKLRLVRNTVIYKPARNYKEKLIAEEVLRRAKSFVNNIVGVL